MIIVPLAPLFLYYAFWTGGDPYWIRYTQIDHVIVPLTPVALLLGLGGLGLLAIPGIWWWIRAGRTLLLPAWAITNIMAAGLPIFSFSSRFALGLLVPVAMLAAIGLERVILPSVARAGIYERFAKLMPTPEATTRRIVLILLSPSVLATLLLFARVAFTNPDFPYYLPQADVVAGQWLGDSAAASSVTLADYPMGNYLPRVYAGKVFLGQLDFTTDLPGKLAVSQRFWDGSMSADEQRSFLQEWGITHVFIGTYEKQLQKETGTPYGQVIYDKNDVIIVQVDK